MAFDMSFHSSVEFACPLSVCLGYLCVPTFPKHACIGRLEALNCPGECVVRVNAD